MIYTTYKIWAEPIDRGDLRLAPGDIKEAIDCFKSETGEQPNLIALCPKNERFGGEVPDGINISYQAGVLRGEVWMANKNSEQTDSESSKSDVFYDMQGVMDGQGIMSTVNPKIFEVDIIPTQTPKVMSGKRGPKFTDLPDDLIKELVAQGMGSKAIATKLVKQGTKVSYKTIQRRIQGVLF